MSERAYYNREFIQWGYVALICVALAFSTITSVVAGTAPSDHSLLSDTAVRHACLIPERANANPRFACELQPATATNQEGQAVIGFFGSSYGSSPMDGFPTSEIPQRKYTD